MAALELLQTRPELVTRLQANAATLRRELERQGLAIESRTHILPLIVGQASSAVRAAEMALEEGVYAQAIRPPTVPAMSSRLRLAVMASHRTEELRRAAGVLVHAAREALAGVDELDDPALVYEVHDAQPEPYLARPHIEAEERLASGDDLFDFEHGERAPVAGVFDFEADGRLAA